MTHAFLRFGGIRLRRFITRCGGFLVLSAALWALPSSLAAPVLRDLSSGQADAALQALDSALNTNPSDAQARNLRCRVYYEEQQWDQAIADCEAAVRLDAGNSNDHLWLGRAYGQKASTVSLMAGYKLAHRVAAEFQQAVQLDPRNIAALDDLGEFDVQAPAVAGGGYRRAAGVLAQLQPLSASAASKLAGRIAESRHDDATAEADFKAAIAQSPSPASAWMDLAAFYYRRSRIPDMLSAAHTGASLDRRHGPALVDGANLLILAHAEPQTAILWLRQYLSSGALSEDAPAFAVHAELAQLLESRGDNSGARQQIAAARSLASGYRIPSTLASVAGLRGQ